MISFFVAGEPVGEPRPRCACVGHGMKKFPKLYTSDVANQWKQLIKVEAQKHRPATPIEGPVRIGLSFMFVRPTSHFTRQAGVLALKTEAPAYHTNKPDFDNLDKTILDTLTSIEGFWKDDAQVAYSSTRKLYAAIGGMPGVFVLIRPLTNALACA